MNNFIPRSFYYKVDIAGDILSFAEASGLQSELVTEELNVGGMNEGVYKLPIRVKHPNLVLKRAFNINVNCSQVTKNTPLYNDWLNKILIEPANLDNHNIMQTSRTITVTLVDPDGTELLIWSLANAFPVKWQLANLSAKENAVAIETIEFSYLFISLTVN